MASFKFHFWSFIIAWTIIAALLYYYELMPLRIYPGVISLTFLNPDIDKAIDEESHRLGLTHSLIPALFYWWCFQPIAGDYSAIIFLIGGCFAWVHLIGDLGGVNGTGLIRVFPYLRLRNQKENKKKKEVDKTWFTLSRRNSLIWLIGNIIAGPIFFVLMLLGFL